MTSVLIVEDNTDLRAIFQKVFLGQDFNVTVALDGKEAMRLLEKELPDILILDVNMPNVSGLKVLRYIRHDLNAQDLRVIVITGNYLAQNEPDAELADLFLVKPVDIDDLVKLARRLLTTNYKIT